MIFPIPRLRPIVIVATCCVGLFVSVRSTVNCFRLVDWDAVSKAAGLILATILSLVFAITFALTLAGWAYGIAVGLQDVVDRAGRAGPEEDSDGSRHD